MDDLVPITWVDDVTVIDDSNFNVQIRNAYLLLLNPPTCSLHRSTTQSVPNGTGWTAMGWDATALVDTENPATPMYDGAAYPTRIVIRTPGWYECMATLEFNVPAAIDITAAFRINGSDIWAGSSARSTTSSGAVDPDPVAMIPLNAGDYVEVVCVHSYTSAVTSVVSGLMPSFSVTRWRGI